MAAPESPSDLPLIPLPEAANHLSSLVYDMSNAVQGAMENMLKMINEIHQNTAVIMEDIEKCKDSAIERKRVLDEDKESYQRAAFTVLDMLTSRD